MIKVAVIKFRIEAEAKHASRRIRLYILFFLSLFLFNVSICKIYIVIYIVCKSMYRYLHCLCHTIVSCFKCFILNQVLK